MRADRLLSLMMLLQTRGRMTADDLAEELEVSVRTIYRDVTALSAAGVPVFCERGPGGGVGLIEEYRTSLTGLSAEETQALFMMDVPAPLAQLGMGQEFKQALLKLSAALPDSRRTDEARSRQRIHLDSTWWYQSGKPLPCLGTIHEALWQERRLRLKVRQEFFNTEFEQEAEPYGLVAKANVWHLVYGRGGSVHVLRIAEVVEAVMLEGTFARPADFDLADFWGKWCAEYESRPQFMARVRVSPQALERIQFYLDERALPYIDGAGKRDEDGWTTLDLPFEILFRRPDAIAGNGASGGSVGAAAAAQKRARFCRADRRFL